MRVSGSSCVVQELRCQLTVWLRRKCKCFWTVHCSSIVGESTLHGNKRLENSWCALFVMCSDNWRVQKQTVLSLFSSVVGCLRASCRWMIWLFQPPGRCFSSSRYLRASTSGKLRFRSLLLPFARPFSQSLLPGTPYDREAHNLKTFLFSALVRTSSTQSPAIEGEFCASHMPTKPSKKPNFPRKKASQEGIKTQSKNRQEWKQDVQSLPNLPNESFHLLTSHPQNQCPNFRVEKNIVEQSDFKPWNNAYFPRKRHIPQPESGLPPCRVPLSGQDKMSYYSRMFKDAEHNLTSTWVSRSPHSPLCQVHNVTWQCWQNSSSEPS